MSSVRLLFDRRGVATNDKPGSVEIEVSEGAVRKRFATGVRITKKQWRNGRVVNHPMAVELNEAIDSALKKYQELIFSPEFSIDRLSSANKEPSRSFVDWMEEEINRRKDIKPNTIKDHRAAVHMLRRWGRIVAFKDLTRANIIALDEYLHSVLKKQSSIHSRHKAIRVYINRAIVIGLITKSPYDGVKISRGKTESRKYLTEEQRKAIEHLNLNGTIAFVRDMFILACYTGLAYADMIKITRDDIRVDGDKMWLVDKRQKTGTPYKLLLLPEAKVILERYDYNMARLTNQKANVYLKGIAAAAGIGETLTMHMGRHTFATWALSKGVRIETVSKMLAHSDITTTQIYAKVLQQEVDKGFELLGDS